MSLTLKEYLLQTYGTKPTNVNEKQLDDNNLEVAVTCVAPSLSSGERLRRNITNLNKNIQNCGVEMFNYEKGCWENPLTKEELAQIRIPVPEILTDVEKLRRASAFAKVKMEQLGGLACDIAERDSYYI